MITPRTGECHPPTRFSFQSFEKVIHSKGLKLSVADHFYPPLKFDMSVVYL